jgi:hypothetical protein
MKVTSVAPLHTMKIKNEDNMWFLVLGINTYFDDAYDQTGRPNGEIEIRRITYTTHYGEIDLEGLPELKLYVDGVWTSDLDFV